jgi:AAA+ ATPase superfamily predicted ATPase
MGQPETCGSQGHAEEIKDNIVKIFEALNDIGRVIVVFDEAQYLRYSTVGLRSVLAHVYDYMDGITLILTGSEVGLLHDFVGVDDPDPELYGRYHSSMELKPLDGEKSREFLRRGSNALI